MSTLCRVPDCQAPTQGFMCKSCARELEQTIAELPADIADLTAVATRQATGPLGLGDNGNGRLWDEAPAEGALGDAPWMFAPGAADQLWALRNTVTTWARHLAESRGAKLPTDVGLIGWLLTNIEAIRFDEAAAQILDEFTALHQENIRWSMGTRGLEVFAGKCDATQVGFEMNDGMLVPVAAQCGAGLYGYEGESEVRCKTCGTRYKLADRLAEIRERQINDQLARAHTIANALTTIDEPLSPTLLRKWIQRDALRDPAPHGPACMDCSHSTCVLIRRCLILTKGTDEDGHPLYRVGDVRARLQLVQAQRGIRLSA